MADRLPKVEQRLTEAKKLLFTRDREIVELTRTADRQKPGAGRGGAINAQQQADIERLDDCVDLPRRRNPDGPSDARSDGEVALRSEIEALRAKIARAGPTAGPHAKPGRAAGRPQVDRRRRRRRRLSVARFQWGHRHRGYKGRNSGPLRRPAASRFRSPAAPLKSRAEDHAAEVARLKAALTVFENEAETESKVSLRESKIGLRARLQSLEAQTVQQTETVQKLRSELAAANERLARQASHFTNELKRLGPGAASAHGQARQTSEAQRLSLADRVAQARVAQVEPTTNGNGAATGAPKPDVAGPAASIGMAASGQTKVADNAASGLETADGNTAASTGSTNAAAAADLATDAGRRPRLLDRISNLARAP